MKKVYQNFGSTVDFNLTGNLPYLKGCGPYETLSHEDGRQSFLILPKMQVNFKSPQKFVNMQNPSEEIRSKTIRGHSWQTSSFVKGMPQLTSECLSGPSYYFEDGYRKVRPYFDCLNNTAFEHRYPGVDIQLADYFTIRFPAFTRYYWETIIENNQIVVNTEKVPPDYKVQAGDVVSHLFHRHENDVLDLEVEKIYENDDFVVVDKPSSWPVYPIGNFKFNSLQYILLREHGYRDLRTVHRIDAATSGVCILAKRAGVSAALQQYFKERSARKQYLALVDGCFSEAEVVCEQPLDHYKISPRKIIKTTAATPRSARTVFRRLSYHGETDTSLVLCVPVTGRTHQIRLHLASLGFFIVNDGLYNEADFEAERTEVPQHEVARLVEAMRNSPNTRPILDTSEPFKHHYCIKCQAPEIFPNQLPTPMCLHSYRYSLGDDFHFESSLPSWAQSPTQIIANRKMKTNNHS